MKLCLRCKVFFFFFTLVATFYFSNLPFMPNSQQENLATILSGHFHGPIPKIMQSNNMGRSQRQCNLKYGPIPKGVAFTKSYTRLTGIADSVECNACGVEKTIEHLQCYCPSFENKKHDLFTALNQLDKKPSILDKILGPWLRIQQLQKPTKALLRFLKTAGLSDRQ